MTHYNFNKQLIEQLSEKNTVEDRLLSLIKDLLTENYGKAGTSVYWRVADAVECYNESCWVPDLHSVHIMIKEVEKALKKTEEVTNDH